MRYLFLFVFALGCATAIAQYDNAGTAAFPFLDIGVDARSLGMGGVSTGMANDLYGALANPATLAFPKRMQAMLAYKPVMLDVQAGAMAFSEPFAGNGTFAANLTYISYGVINGRDENNNPTMAYNPYSLVGGISWARIFYEGLGLGVTAKVIYHNLDHGYSADGAAADLGLQYRMLSSRLVLGALVRNMGFVRKWYSAGDDSEDHFLPFAASTGLSYLPAAMPSMRIAIDLNKTIDDYLNYKTGIEVALYRQYLFARLGYAFSQSDLRELFRVVGNASNDTYQKTNWDQLTIGVGVYAPISGAEVKIDAALVLHTEGLPPTPSFSAIIGF